MKRDLTAIVGVQAAVGDVDDAVRGDRARRTAQARALLRSVAISLVDSDDALSAPYIRRVLFEALLADWDPRERRAVIDRWTQGRGVDRREAN